MIKPSLNLQLKSIDFEKYKVKYFIILKLDKKNKSTYIPFKLTV